MIDKSVFEAAKFKLLIETLGNRVISTRFVDKLVPNLKGNGYTLEVERQLEEFISGERDEFDLNLGEGKLNAVYERLLEVPIGETISYGKLAEKAGMPGAARAIGSMMKTNPLVILVPCHRVILASGELGEYVGGRALKLYLLELENRVANIRR